MIERRRPPHLVTPEYEDGGIFRTPPQQLLVELVPKIGKNTRSDLMVKGFIDGTIAIDVVFAGRRTKQADLLLKKLQSLWTQANRKTAPGDEPPEVDTVRLPVRVEGSWRPRFERDDQGWETRTHQLFAARWVLNHDGESKTFGEPPVKVRAPM